TPPPRRVPAWALGAIAVVALLGVVFLVLVLTGAFAGRSPDPAPVVEGPKAEFKVDIIDESEERLPGTATYKIEDEPEEKDPKKPPPLVKVEIKDEPGDAGGPVA